MKNFLGSVATIDFVAGANLTGGSPLLVGNTFGVVVADVLNGNVGSLFVGPGVVTLPKAAAITPANGARLFWDNAAGNVTATAAGNTLIGHAVLPVAGAADPTIAVRLNGTTPA